jgi:hypothetical protein
LPLPREPQILRDIGDECENAFLQLLNVYLKGDRQGSPELMAAFYGLLSASLMWEKGHFAASVWGKNLLDEEYNTFYFRSIGNDFFAQGKPLQVGVSLHVNL